VLKDTRLDSSYLQPNPRRGVFDKQLTVADVAAHHGDRPVTRLGHDGALGFAGLGCAGGEAGAQGIAIVESYVWGDSAAPVGRSAR